MAGNRRRRQRGRLIGFSPTRPAQMVLPDLEWLMRSGKADTRGSDAPDVTDDVAQDRKRQEP